MGSWVLWPCPLLAPGCSWPQTNECSRNRPAMSRFMAFTFLPASATSNACKEEPYPCPSQVLVAMATPAPSTRSKDLQVLSMGRSRLLTGAGNCCRELSGGDAPNQSQRSTCNLNRAKDLLDPGESQTCFPTLLCKPFGGSISPGFVLAFLDKCINKSRKTIFVFL